jgi:gentisate 1,2-dioxygenase
MEPGDLLTQPTWTWHGTTNTGAEPAIWFTAMDSTLMQHLDNWVNERYPESFSQPITKPDGYHMSRLGALRPTAGLGVNLSYPIKYCWRDTIAALEATAAAGESDPFDGVVLDYVEPRSGGPTTATLHCRIQLLRPGEATQSHRHTGSTVYHVVRGNGAVQVGASRGDEVSLSWQERDCFNVPTWYWHRLQNFSLHAPAILFSVTDRPIFEALRLYREQS